MRYVILFVAATVLGIVFYLAQPSRETMPVTSGGGPDDAAALLAADTLDAAALANAPQDTTPRGRGLALLARADAHADAGRTANALAAYDSAAALLPGIERWIALHAAEAAAEAGDTVEVKRRLDAAGSAVVNRYGWDIRVRALEEAGALADAIEAAKSIAATSSGGRKASALTTVGRLRLLRGDTARAVSALREAIDASNTAYDAARILSDLPGITLDDQLAIGRIYLRGGNMARASRGIRAWLDAGRGTAAERRNLRLDLGRGFFRAGEYASAERELRAGAEGAPASVAAPALYDAARARYRLGQVTEARSALRSLAQQYPGSATAARAWYLLGDLDQDDENFDDARANFRRAIETGADSEEVGLAYMRIAGMEFAAGDYAAARERFDAYRTRYPSGRRAQQAVYWSGVASHHLGDPATARARFQEALRMDPMDYYGVRAAERLDTTPRDAMTLGAAPAAAPLTAATTAALDVVDVLRDAGWSDAAAFEMDRARDSFGSDVASLYALAEALNERGYTSQGIRMGLDLRRRAGQWNPRLLRIVYPMPYRDAITAEAARHGIDPYLAAGLIRQESLFNARAVSPAGAMGLMQVMPATGERLARRLGISSFQSSMLRDPLINIRLGMQFLADMIAEYDGRVDAVLAAYNAGPSRVDRWMEFPEWENPELFSERIPFAETREYVKIVQQNARLYNALYGSARGDE
ncbi:MAG: lytic transglycosylase domain-containing protein [Longimicrobiales bacterium]